MAYSIGFDTGVKSLGVCLKTDDNKILKTESIIFQNNHKADSTPAKNRTLVRSQRKNKYRTTKRIKKVINILKRNDMYDESFYLESNLKFIYENRFYALDGEIHKYNLGRIFIFFAKHRGYNRINEYILELKKKLGKDKDVAKFFEPYDYLNSKINNNSYRTPGEYYYKTKYINSGLKPVKMKEQVHVYREQYKKEFDMICKAQKISGELYDELYRAIYDQRPLKSQKHTRKKCIIDGKYGCCQSLNIYQSYRILEEISKIKLIYPDNEERVLSSDSIKLLSKYLKYHKEIKINEFFELLNINPKEEGVVLKYSELFPIKGNSTFKRIWDCIPDTYKNKSFKNDDSEVDEKQKDLMIEEIYNELNMWNDYSTLHKKYRKKYGITDECMLSLLEIQFQKNYSTLSENIIRKKLDSFKNTQKFLYDIKKEIKIEPKIGTRIELLTKTEITNPYVRKSANLAIKRLNVYIKEYGYPESICIEMSKQFYSKESPKSIKSKQDNKKDFNTIINSELPDLKYSFAYHLFLELPFFENTKDNHKKYYIKNGFNNKKWDSYFLKSSRMCLYTGREIKFEDIFGGKLEKDHIIPQSIKPGFDSIFNRVLCYKDTNKEKSNKIPYFFLNGEEWKAYIKRCEFIMPFDGKYKEKIKHLTSTDIENTFSAKSINDNSYTAKALIERLKEYLPESTKINVTNGLITHSLRKAWEMPVKYRGINTHHATDAIAIAFTTDEVRNQIVEYHKNNIHNKPLTILKPFQDFSEVVKEQIDNNTFVTIEKSKPLLTKRNNNYKKGNSIHTQKKVLSIRGELMSPNPRGKYVLGTSEYIDEHYDQIKKNDNVLCTYRKSIQDLNVKSILKCDTFLDKPGTGNLYITDSKIALILKDYIKKYDTNQKYFEKNIINFLKENQLPYRKVKVFEKHSPSSLIKIKKNGVESVFVSNNNYGTAICQNIDTGKIITKKITNFDIVKNYNKNIKIPIEKGFEIKRILRLGDMVEIIKKDGECYLNFSEIKEKKNNENVFVYINEDNSSLCFIKNELYGLAMNRISSQDYLNEQINDKIIPESIKNSFNYVRTSKIILV